MKRISVFLVFGALCQVSFAYNFSATAPSGQTLYYSYVNGSTGNAVSVVRPSNSNYGYTEPSGSLVIPDTVYRNGNAYIVTSIGNRAFSTCTGLTSVIIGNSVSSIGDFAFYDCVSLRSVTIPNSVTNIGYKAFAITYTYSGGLDSVAIPNSVTSIGNAAFFNCYLLSSVVMSNSVTSIGDSTFMYCSNLTSVTIPNSVTNIGYAAFCYCTSLTLVIPNSVSNIGTCAFQSVRHIEYHGNASGSPWGALLMNGVSDGDFVYLDTAKTHLTAYRGFGGNVTIPSTVTSIGQYAFYGCRALTSVTIPNTVSNIGDSAFYNTGLTSVTIPNSVTEIGSEAFYCCGRLRTVNYNADSCNIVGKSPFWRNSLSTINIGNNVRIIPSRLFYHGNHYNNDGPPFILRDTNKVRTVTIPASVTHIGDSAFFGCPLDSIIPLPQLAPTLGYAAFGGSRYKIYLACAFDSSYITDNSWNNYRSRLTTPDIGLTCRVEADTLSQYYGTVYINQQYNRDVFCDSTAIVRAYANSYNSNCHFGYWSNGNTANPDTLHLVGDTAVIAHFVHLTIGVNDQTRGTAQRRKVAENKERILATANAHYHFDHWSNGRTANPDTVHIVSDSTVTAYFLPDRYTVTVNVNDENLGSVSFPNGNTADYLDTIMVVAHPIDHHHVVRWSGNRITSVSVTKDTAYVAITGNLNISCYFAIDTHSVNVSVNDITRGIVEPSTNQYVYGTPCTLTATAYTGYTFYHWSNGVTANPYTFAVMEDVELTAIFLSPDEMVTITAESGNPSMGTATVNGTSSVTVLSGEEVTLTATPFTGYRFLRWQDDDSLATRTVTATSNITYTAYFERNVGIDDIDATVRIPNVYTDGRRIMVEGAEGLDVRVYDMMGRTVLNESLPAGVYLVKVGDWPARRIVMLR